MKKYLLSLLIAVLFFCTQITSQSLLDGPESVAYHPGTNCYYVSSLMNNRVIKIDLAGNQTLFADNLIAFGNCIRGDILYVSSGAYVRGFDAYTGTEVFTAHLPSTTQLDGITFDDNGYLYVVATLRQQIFRINLSDSSSSVFVPSGLETATQDLIYDPINDRILVCAFGAGADIVSIDPNTGSITTRFDAVGRFDGITIDESGFIFLGTHVNNGQIIMYDSDFQNGSFILAENQGQPAGLDYNMETRTIAVPDFIGDTVRYFNVREDHLSVDFSVNIHSGHLPLQAEFMDLSFTDKIITKWEWDFDGDGSTDSELQNPSYTYSSAGYYDVTLTVTTIVGSLSTTFHDYVRIFNGESSVEFYGGNNHTEIPASPELALNSDFTIEAAIKPNEWGNQITGSTIFDKGAVRVYFIEQGFLGTKNESLVLLLTFNDNSIVKFAAPEGSIALDNWQHIAVSFNSTTVEPALFINGFEQSINVIGNIPTDISLKNNDATNIKIANSININTGVAGSLDELRIWNYRRTQQEISAEMLHVLAGNENGLVGYWNMNEGNGIEILDLTANSNSGIIDGGKYAAGIDFSSLTDVENEKKLQLNEFKLFQNYPNPFNPTTRIEYRIQKPDFVSLKVYDILGNEITLLINEQQLPGTYRIEFDAADYSSGIYFYTLSAGAHSLTKKMIVLK